MKSNKTNLFAALASAAHLTIDGHPAIGVMVSAKTKTATIMGLEGKSLVLNEQDISIDGEGTATVVDTDGQDYEFVFENKAAKGAHSADLSEMLSAVLGGKKTSSSLGQAIAAIASALAQKEEKPFIKPVPPGQFNKEQVADQLISPLIRQVADICKEHDITFVAGFHTPTPDKPHLNVLSANMVKDSPAAYRQALDVLRPNWRNSDNDTSDLDTGTPAEEDIDEAAMKQHIAEIMGKIQARAAR